MLGGHILLGTEPEFTCVLVHDTDADTDANYDVNETTTN